MQLTPTDFYIKKNKNKLFNEFLIQINNHNVLQIEKYNFIFDSGFFKNFVVYTTTEPISTRTNWHSTNFLRQKIGLFRNMFKK